MLRTAPFSELLLHRVQAFRCGDQPWDLEVSDWIKTARGGGGSLDDLANGNCDVWIYLNDQDDVVGFSSLGSTKWHYPTLLDKRQQISIIPNVAVESRFQGQGLFAEILGHLFFEAKQHDERLPLIGLFVDPRNEAAVRVYERKGFEAFHHSYTDRQTGVNYRGMICKLPE